MLLSKADQANCVRAILSFALRRWLWLMPNPITGGLLRETEKTIIIACWTQPGPGHSVNTLSCNVGLFQPKTFQSACNWFVYIYKKNPEIGPMMHVLCTGYSQNLSASPVHLASWFLGTPERNGDQAIRCLQEVTGHSLPVGLRFALVLTLAQYVQNVQNSLHLWYDTAFPKPPIHFVDLRVCGLTIIVIMVISTIFSVLLARKHAYLSMFFFFPLKRKIKIVAF